MALHDVDKNSADRGSPMPNVHDVKEGVRPAHGTNVINYVTDATSVPVTGNGAGGGSSGGGSSVTAGYKKLAATATIRVTNDGSTLTTASLPHGLSFVPKVEGYLQNANSTIATGTATNSTIALPTFLSADISAANDIKFKTWVYTLADSTYIYVNMLNTTGSTVTCTITCYLYQIG